MALHLSLLSAASRAARHAGATGRESSGDTGEVFERKDVDSDVCKAASCLRSLTTVRSSVASKIHTQINRQAHVVQ